MATKIRLRRVGRKGQAYFRIVVADSKSPRDGRFVATIGNYNPRAKPAVIDVDAEQARAWLDKGATPTDTVRSLLRKAGVLGGGQRSPTPPAAA
jgi:small subunit ribosomal protein S16